MKPIYITTTSRRKILELSSEACNLQSFQKQRGYCSLAVSNSALWRMTFQNAPHLRPFWQATLTSRLYPKYASTGFPEGQKTALYETHIRYGGKMFPFAGFSMPVSYSDLGISESHRWTREKASLFDVGHMYFYLPKQFLRNEY